MTSYNDDMAASHITRTSAGVQLGVHRPHVTEPIIDAGTIVLGMVLSIAAVMLTVLLATFGEVSQWSLVVSVAGIGFVASWVRSASAHRRRPAIVTISH